MPVSIIRIQKLFVIGNELFFYLTNKETSKGWVCDNFPRQFHFFLGAIHEKHKFKYFKNLTVKQFVKYGAMMSICLFFSVTFFGGN
jgi:hypothetical protein